MAINRLQLFTLTELQELDNGLAVALDRSLDTDGTQAYDLRREIEKEYERRKEENPWGKVKTEDLKKLLNGLQHPKLREQLLLELKERDSGQGRAS